MTVDQQVIDQTSQSYRRAHQHNLYLHSNSCIELKKTEFAKIFKNNSPYLQCPAAKRHLGPCPLLVVPGSVQVTADQRNTGSSLVQTSSVISVSRPQMSAGTVLTDPSTSDLHPSDPGSYWQTAIESKRISLHLFP